MQKNADAVRAFLRNKTCGWSKVSSVLRAHPCHEPIRDEMILDILTHHPCYERKRVGECLALTRRPAGSGRFGWELAMHFPDGSAETASLKTCINAIFDGQKAANVCNMHKDVDEALRNEVMHPLTNMTAASLFRRERKGQECDNVECRRAGADVDHAGSWPFARIRDEFFSQQRPACDVSPHYDAERSKRMFLADRALAARWISFHDSKAAFRLLCKQCNSACGCRAYKRKRREGWR